MTHQEFSRWLDEGVRADRMSDAKRSDLLAQKVWFDSNRKIIETEYRGRIVGCSNQNLFVGDTVHGVLAAAKKKDPQAMVYFEPVGFDII